MWHRGGRFDVAMHVPMAPRRSGAVIKYGPPLTCIGCSTIHVVRNVNTEHRDKDSKD